MFCSPPTLSPGTPTQHLSRAQGHKATNLDNHRASEQHPPSRAPDPNTFVRLHRSTSLSHETIRAHPTPAVNPYVTYWHPGKISCSLGDLVLLSPSTPRDRRMLYQAFFCARLLVSAASNAPGIPASFTAYGVNCALLTFMNHTYTMDI